jgi:predicted dehydrogenase
MNDGSIRLGVIGAGGFGLFALQHFTQIPGVVLVGMAGTHREAAFAVAQRFGIPDIQDIDALVARPDIDLVYIATPPFLHHLQSMKALAAGKHVICEKPLAVTLEQADEMVALARKNHRLLIANLMQRYNPLFDTVQQLVERRVLGEFLHGFFENYATDEGLPPEHWFWDLSKSGGIFIEHGVHFFDLFAGWLGPGRVVAAQQTPRPGANLLDQVQCTVRYAGGTGVSPVNNRRDAGPTAFVNMYHGFTQPGRMDRQELRLLFERGDVTLEEWVPVRVKIRAVADEKGTRELMDLFPGARLDVTKIYGGPERAARARHKTLDLYQMIDVTYGLETEKMHRYGELLRSMLRDQIQWINNPKHHRKITDANGRDSLALAVEATRLAAAAG